MMLDIRIEQPPDHPLVLSVVPSRLAFKELDATLTQNDSDLNPLVADDEVFRTR
jgi:hypothetical protein